MILNKKLDKLIKDVCSLEVISQHLIADLNKIYPTTNHNVFTVNAYDIMNKDNEGIDDELEFIIDLNKPIELIKYKIYKNVEFNEVDFIFYIRPTQQKGINNEECFLDMEYQYRENKLFLIDYSMFYDSKPFLF